MFLDVWVGCIGVEVVELAAELCRLSVWSKQQRAVVAEPWEVEVEVAMLEAELGELFRHARSEAVVKIFRVAAELGASSVGVGRERVVVKGFGLIAARSELSSWFWQRRVVLEVIGLAVRLYKVSLGHERLKVVVAVVRSAAEPSELSIWPEQQ